MDESNRLSLQNFLQELSQIRGMDFRGYKYNSLERRLRKRMQQINVHGYDEYLDYLHRHPAEVTELLQTILINVTTFFRDPYAWEALRTEALPIFLDRMKTGDVFRAWCAGCATGEEVYSLAILLAEHFGSRLPDYEIKIYATDQDEDALNVARRGEYPAERLKNVRPEWREKYFQGGKILRINRELRRFAIFGRSNLVSDAPISHVNLLICRNVLIYFDIGLQKQVLQRFRYALEENGVLFLGKAESQLRESNDFRIINAKWRIFQCSPKERVLRTARPEEAGTLNMDKAQQELESLRNFQDSLLSTLRQAVVVLDDSDVVRVANDAALSIWGSSREELLGKQLNATALAMRSPEILSSMQRLRVSPSENIQVNVRFHVNGEERGIMLTLRMLGNAQQQRVGTLIYAEDVSSHEKLRNTIEELESTAEELHSANEELETTNEELQSTNEELETTNEELQSTNEELETTNEELHSLNEELETTNDELEMRTRELDENNRRYAETLEAMPSPIFVVGEDQKVGLWNTAAQKLFGLESRVMVGLNLQQLPIPVSLRTMLLRRVKTVIHKKVPTSLKVQNVKLNGFRGTLTAHLTPVNIPTLRSVLVIVDPVRGATKEEKAAGRANSTKAKSKKGAKRVTGKSKAAKKKPGRR